MSILILAVLILYSFVVLCAFARNVHNNSIYEICNYTDMKSEMYCDLLDACCFPCQSLKGVTWEEIKNLTLSFFNFFIAYFKKCRGLKSRQDWLSWSADKYNSKNLIFTFLLFIVFKLLFEHHGEQNIYDYIISRKVQY
jgi:hypothetical protein